MTVAPKIVVFDVNETLSDLGPLAGRFADVGVPGELAGTWFSSVLRDGFALTAAGTREAFAVIADEVLRGVLATAVRRGARLDRSEDDAVAHVLAGFGDLPVHPDVPDGIRALRASGLRLVTLSNGGVQVAEQLLTSAGLREEFEGLHSVEQAGAWKPAPAAYHYIARTYHVEPVELLLVAVHPWDLDGAARAGLRTGWIDRTGARFPRYFIAPEFTAPGLVELATQLAG